nr:capsid protein [Ora Rivulet insect-associated polycipivirus]
MTDTIIERERAKQLENSEPPITELENLNLMPTTSVLNDRQLAIAPSWTISEFESMKKLIYSFDVEVNQRIGLPFLSITIDNFFLRNHFTDFLKTKFGLMSADICFEIYIQSHWQQVGSVIFSTTNATPNVLAVISSGKHGLWVPSAHSKLPSIVKKLGHSWTEHIKIPWHSNKKFTGTGYNKSEAEDFHHATLMASLLTAFRTEGLPKFTVRVFTYLQNLQYSSWQP